MAKKCPKRVIKWPTYRYVIPVFYASDYTLVGSGQGNSPTNYLLGLPKYLLNGNHYNVDNGNIVDGPSNPFCFIKMSPGFANTEANLNIINDLINTQ